MGESQRRWAEKKAEERRELAQFKRDYPEKFAQMMQDARNREAARLVEEQKQEELRIERRRLQESVTRKLTVALIPRELPIIPGIQKIRGRLALRQWNINGRGYLTSNGYRDDEWHSQMIADEVPTQRNTHGLYCIQMSPEGFLGSAGGRVSEYCGMIELRGHLEYHEKEQGIRAEWAKILGIFVTDNTADVYWRVPKLMEHYPNVPLFITTRELVAKYLMRLVMWQETGDERILYNTTVR
jgi:hypothetical protein